MSSSSSSECLCPDCFRYGNLNYRATAPFYKTMGHPLIYYAQVEPQFFSRRSKGSKDDNPNCFVKAFRWYTQEHYSQKAVPQCDKQTNREELSGFATWLDRKYDQYLKDKGFQEFTKVDSAAPCTTNKTDTGGQCEVNCKKLCTRPLSPWAKRWRQVKSKEQGCTLQRSHQSCEYILEPKDLSRATSECCQQLSASNRSIVVTAASSDTQTSKKTVVKSHSTDKIEFQKRICNILNSKGKCGGDIAVKNSSTWSKTIKNKSLNDKIRKHTADFACQCPDEKNYWTSDKQTQYEKRDFHENCECHPTSDCISPSPTAPSPPPPTSTSTIVTKSSSINNPPALCPCEKQPSKPKPSTNNLVRIESTASCQCRLQPHPKVNVASQYHRNIEKNDCQCAKESEKFLAKKKYPQPQKLEKSCMNCSNCLPRIPPKPPVVLMSPPKFEDIKPICINLLTSKINDGAAQTSDHSIDLEAACNRKYPFFMKIICADKLKEEYGLK